jgi:hypothetical protein
VFTRGGRVALVEQQIEDFEHRGEPRCQFCGSRHLERNARFSERAFGTHDALRHGRFWNKERARDFDCSQAAQHPQRECRA